MSKKPTLTLKPPSLDSPLGPQLLQDYGDDLEQDMTTDQKEALLVTLWNIMVIMADLGIDLGPVPEKHGDKPAKNGADNDVDMLSSTGFEDTAHEKPALRLSKDEEEKS